MATRGWESATKADINRLLNRAQTLKKSKYKAQPTVLDGIRFDSKKEAGRYLELKALERAGEIEKLELQPPFPLEVHQLLTGCHMAVGKYRADFAYLRNGERVIEDVKSSATRTDLYRLKKKIVEFCHSVTIVEI